MSLKIVKMQLLKSKTSKYLKLCNILKLHNSIYVYNIRVRMFLTG